MLENNKNDLRFLTFKSDKIVQELNQADEDLMNTIFDENCEYGMISKKMLRANIAIHRQVCLDIFKLESFSYE